MSGRNAGKRTSTVPNPSASTLNLIAPQGSFPHSINWTENEPAGQTDLPATNNGNL
jgi:hypothetical protein